MQNDSQGTYREGNRRRRSGSPLLCVLFVCMLLIATGYGALAAAPGTNLVNALLGTGKASAASAPSARDDRYTATEDRTLTVRAPGVLRNDRRTGGSLSAAMVSGPDHGQLTLGADGSFTYEPDPDYNGQDSFTYKANDGTSDSNEATVRITVRAVNDAPLAEDDEYVVRDHETLNVSAPGVLGNDTDIEGDRFSATRRSGPQDGRLILRRDGSFVYQPGNSFDETDSFSYRVSDGRGGSDTATVTIKSNNPPTADDDSYTVDEDTTLTINAPGVLDGDADADNDPLTAIKVTDPANGQLTAFNADGSFDYAPNANFSGRDLTFGSEFRQTDGG